MNDSCVLTPKPAQITKEECLKIIEKKFNNANFEIIDYKLSRLDEKCGFLGEHFRLTIKVQQHGHEPVDVFCFAKFLPENPAQIEFAVLTGSFKKEVFAYETIFPKINSTGIGYLKSCIPECYFVKSDYVLVFEDVCKRGFQPLGRYGYLDYDHILVIVKMLAKFHAASLILEEVLSKNQGKPYRFIEEYPNSFYESFYIDEKTHRGGQGLYAALKGLQTAVDLFPHMDTKISNEEFKKRIFKACKRIFRLVKPSSKFRNVICHGDLWCTNFMMQYKDGRPSECLLLDFQILRYCPPSHDFMSFLHLTSTREFRQRHLLDLQRTYYGELETLLAHHGLDLSALIPYEEFVVSCQEQRQFAAVQTATYCQMTQIKEEAVKIYGNDRERWNIALYVDRSEMVLENCKNDPEYKQVLNDAVKELRILCEEMEI